MLIILWLTQYLLFKIWFTNSYFLSGDTNFYFYDGLKSFLHLTVWSSLDTTGQFDYIIIWRKLFDFFYGTIGLLGLNSNVSNLIFFYFPLIFICPSIIYIILKKYYKFNTINSYLISLLLSLNNYSLSILTQGHYHLVLSVNLSMIGFLLFIKGYKFQNKLLLVASLLLFFISGIVDFRFLYIFIILIIFYFIFLLYVNSSLSKFILHSTLLIINLFSFFSFWFLPLIHSSSFSFSFNIFGERPLFGSGFQSILNSITFHHPFWSGGYINWFVRNNPNYYLWLFPLTLTFLLSFQKKIIRSHSSEYLFFLLICIIFIFLSKQNNPPFKQIYGFLYNYFPGLKNAFRESSKFIPVAFFSYIIYVFSSLNKLNLKAQKFVIIGLIIPLLFIIKPVFFNDIKTIFLPYSIPSDYLDLASFLKKNADYYRVGWFPSRSYWAYSSNLNPSIRLDLILNNFSVSKKKSASEDLEYNQYLSNYSFNHYLNLLGIRYLVIPIFNNTYEPIFKSPQERAQIIDDFDRVYNNKFLIRRLVLYENTDYRPHIYKTEEIETIKKQVDYEKVDHIQINPTQYSVSLRGVEKGFFLNFSESYHPDWSVRVGKFNWFNSLLDKQYFLSNRYHIKNDAQLNSFYIDPEKVCDRYECRMNPDGTYDMDITLFFKPQAWFYVGLIISGTTLTGLLGALIYLGLRSLHLRSSRVSHKLNPHT